MHVIDRLLRITGRLLSKSDRRCCVFIKVIAFFFSVGELGNEIWSSVIFWIKRHSHESWTGIHFNLNSKLS